MGYERCPTGHKSSFGSARASGTRKEWSMNWTDHWPMGLMWASLLLFVGTLIAVIRFLNNASERSDGRAEPGDENRADDDCIDTRPGRSRSSEGSVVLGLMVFVVAVTVSYAALAHRPGEDRALPRDGVLWTPKALLRDFFVSSERVEYQRTPLTTAEQTYLAAFTRTERENPTHVLYVARTGARRRVQSPMGCTSTCRKTVETVRRALFVAPRAASFDLEPASLRALQRR